MFDLLTPAHWSQAAREARAGPYVEGVRTPRPWLTLLIFLGVGAVMVAAAVLAIGTAMTAADAAGWVDLNMLALEVRAETLVDETSFIAVLAVVLFTLALAVLAAAMIAYRRGPGAFLWPTPRGSLGLFAAGFAVMFAVSLALWPVIQAMEPGPPGPLLDTSETLDARLIYAGAATLGLLIAAAAEEIAFRGVLLRITAGFRRSLWLILLINGVLFAAIHWDPDPVAFVARAASGMVWAWAALRLGNLAFAIGAHLANNLFIALLLAPISEAAVPGQDLPVEILGLEAVSLLAVLVAVEILARRRTDRA
jgi:membrane protease YdiL (CAAX protease family)